MPAYDITTHFDENRDNNEPEIITWLKDNNAYYGKTYANDGRVYAFIPYSVLLMFKLYWPDTIRVDLEHLESVITDKHALQGFYEDLQTETQQIKKEPQLIDTINELITF